MLTLAPRRSSLLFRAIEDAQLSDPIVLTGDILERAN
jgi:hypothetical protein